MKDNNIDYKIVEIIPDHIENGVIYISERYKTAIHKCCCGCGEEVVTPLIPTDWSVRINDHKVTLHPSIGNWSFACRSHYWIRDGRVEWSYDMSPAAIEKIRTQDKHVKDQYFKKVNEEKAAKAPQPKWINKLINIVKKWFGL